MSTLLGVSMTSGAAPAAALLAATNPTAMVPPPFGMPPLGFPPGMPAGMPPPMMPPGPMGQPPPGMFPPGMMPGMPPMTMAGPVPPGSAGQPAAPAGLFPVGMPPTNVTLGGGGNQPQFPAAPPGLQQAPPQPAMGSNPQGGPQPAMGSNPQGGPLPPAASAQHQFMPPGPSHAPMNMQQGPPPPPPRHAPPGPPSSHHPRASHPADQDGHWRPSAHGGQFNPPSGLQPAGTGPVRPGWQGHSEQQEQQQHQQHQHQQQQHQHQQQQHQQHQQQQQRQHFASHPQNDNGWSRNDQHWNRPGDQFDDRVQDPGDCRDLNPPPVTTRRRVLLNPPDGQRQLPEGFFEQGFELPGCGPHGASTDLGVSEQIHTADRHSQAPLLQPVPVSHERDAVGAGFESIESADVQSASQAKASDVSPPVESSAEVPYDPMDVESSDDENDTVGDVPLDGAVLAAWRSQQSAQQRDADEVNPATPDKNGSTVDEIAETTQVTTVISPSADDCYAAVGMASPTKSPSDRSTGSVAAASPSKGDTVGVCTETAASDEDATSEAIAEGSATS